MHKYLFKEQVKPAACWGWADSNREGLCPEKPPDGENCDIIRSDTGQACVVMPSWLCPGPPQFNQVWPETSSCLSDLALQTSSHRPPGRTTRRKLGPI